MAIIFDREIARKRALTDWPSKVLQQVGEEHRDTVARTLVSAMLTRKFGPSLPSILSYQAQASAKLGGGEFVAGSSVFHATYAPSLEVLEKCVSNLSRRLRPILLVVADYKAHAKALAAEFSIENRVTIVSLEDYLAFSCLGISVDENEDPFKVVEETLQLYNKRLAEVETDLSLQISVH